MQYIQLERVTTHLKRQKKQDKDEKRTEAEAACR